MSFLNKHVWILLLSASCITLLFSGCYKKDLDEFKKVNTWTYQPELAIPFIQKRITLNDTIPTIPGFTTITMSDTTNINLPINNDSTLVQEVQFKVRFENTFPFTGRVQVYFADSNNVYRDSLLDNSNRFIDQGNPTFIKEFVVDIDHERYKILTKNKHMYLFYSLTTSNINGISSDYFMIDIGAKAKLEVNLDSNSNK